MRYIAQPYSWLDGIFGPHNRVSCFCDFQKCRLLTWWSWCCIKVWPVALYSFIKKLFSAFAFKDVEQKKSGNYFFLDDWRSHFTEFQKCSRSIWHQTSKRWHCGLTCLTELPSPLQTYSSAPLLSSRPLVRFNKETRHILWHKAKLVRRGHYLKIKPGEMYVSRWIIVIINNWSSFWSQSGANQFTHTKHATVYFE